jgi:hypothetical protein
VLVVECSEGDRSCGPRRWQGRPLSRSVGCDAGAIGVRIGATIVGTGATIAGTGVRSINRFTGRGSSGGATVHMAVAGAPGPAWIERLRDPGTWRATA